MVDGAIANVGVRGEGMTNDDNKKSCGNIFFSREERTVVGDAHPVVQIQPLQTSVDTSDVSLRTMHFCILDALTLHHTTRTILPVRSSSSILREFINVSRVEVV